MESALSGRNRRDLVCVHFFKPCVFAGVDLPQGDAPRRPRLDLAGGQALSANATRGLVCATGLEGEAAGGFTIDQVGEMPGKIEGGNG